MEAFWRYDMARQKEHLLQEIQSANVLLAQVNLDLAAAIENKDSQIDRVVHYDALTNLPNRLLFLDRLDQELTRAHRDNSMMALLSVDLDRFKQVNDSFGHPVGDQLLQAVAGRLSSQIRACDTVARVAGDEFCIVLTGVKTTHAAGEVAQKILDSFAHNPIFDRRQRNLCHPQHRDQYLSGRRREYDDVAKECGCGVASGEG